MSKLTNTYRQGVSGVTFLDAELRDTSDGVGASATSCRLGSVVGGSPVDRRVIMQVDISDIPKSALISSATLTVIPHVFYGSGSVDVYASIGDEAQWAAAVSSSIPTWAYVTTDVGWSTVGGSKQNTTMFAATMPASGSTLDLDITRIASLAKRYDDGILNFVLYAVPEGTVGKSFKFYSGNNSTESNRPILSITYIEGSGSGFGGKSKLSPVTQQKRFNKRK